MADEQKNGITVTVAISQDFKKLPLESDATFIPDGEPAPTLEQVVDADIDGFATYFCGELNNASLADSERAIIKTYLWYKTQPHE